VATYFRATRERDLVHARIGYQPFTHGSARADDKIDRAVWKSCLHEYLAKLYRGKRSCCRRFQHNRIPGSERRSYLVRNQIQREIKRADGCDHTNRAARPKPKVAFSRRHSVQGDGFPMQALCFLRGNRKGANRSVHFRPRKLERLPRFGSDCFCHIVGAFADQCGSAKQDLCSFVGRHVCHYIFRALGSGYGCIYIFLAGGGHCADYFAVVFVFYL
jgi:hypothetical protein